MFQSVYQVCGAYYNNYADFYQSSCGIQALIAISVAAFLFYGPGKVPARFHYLNAEHQCMLDSLKASGLNWIALLPPHLTGDNQYFVMQIYGRAL